jgi:hypothetical protein
VLLPGTELPTRIALPLGIALPIRTVLMPGIALLPCSILLQRITALQKKSMVPAHVFHMAWNHTFLVYKHFPWCEQDAQRL